MTRMTFTISIPHKSRDESLVDVMSHCRDARQDETRDVMRQLVYKARIDHGITTAGALLDFLNGLDAPGRRALLDEARQECALPSLEELEIAERAEATIRRGTVPPMPRCAVGDCPNVPTRFGAFYDPGVRRWWCPEHEHLAQPGDLEPHGSGLRLSPSGVPIPVDADEEAAEREREETHRGRLAAQAEIRAVEAAQARASKQAADEAARSTLPPHLRGVPA